MPTGYTAKLYDGDQDFNEFIMGCARAFGALIMMRDESSDAQIPEKFYPSDYHLKEFIKASDKLKRLKSMSDDERQIAARKEYDDQVAHYNSEMTTCALRRKRYGHMLENVESWQPPTEDHLGLKTFMIDQIKSSIFHDCATVSEEPKLLSGPQWWQKEVGNAEWNIEYHEKEYKEEVKRTDGRNKWLSELRESIKKTTVPSSQQ